VRRERDRNPNDRSQNDVLHQSRERGSADRLFTGRLRLFATRGTTSRAGRDPREKADPLLTLLAVHARQQDSAKTFEYSFSSVKSLGGRTGTKADWYHALTI
jgi:hypothetical protein